MIGKCPLGPQPRKALMRLSARGGSKIDFRGDLFLSLRLRGTGTRTGAFFNARLLFLKIFNQENMIRLAEKRATLMRK